MFATQNKQLIQNILAEMKHELNIVAEQMPEGLTESVRADKLLSALPTIVARLHNPL